MFTEVTILKPVKPINLLYQYDHPEYCLTGTESWWTQNNTSPEELTEAQYDCKQSKDILCCHRKKIRSSQISGEIKQGTEWKTGSSHLTMQGSQQFEVSFSNSGQILKQYLPPPPRKKYQSCICFVCLQYTCIYSFIHFFLCFPQFCPSGQKEKEQTKRCSIQNFPLIST